MTIFTCTDSFEAMMTCIYDAWASRLGHSNIRLELEQSDQYTLFCDYRHIDPDPAKARSVISSIQKKISPFAYRQVYMASMSDQEDRLDAVYRFLILGFAAGSKVTDLYTRPEVVRVFELSRRSVNEAHYYKEFARFNRLGASAYVAHIEPKCNVLTVSAEHFADRMPSENWIIIDDKRSQAVIHPADEDFYLRVLSSDELAAVAAAEQTKDRYSDLWKTYFSSISIRERENPVCQRTHLPIWYRTHMTEFQSP